MEPEIEAELIQKLEGFEIKKLLRSSSQEFNFKEIEYDLTEIRDWSRKLFDDNKFWNGLTVQKKGAIRENLINLASYMDQMQSFDVEGTNPSEARRNIITIIHSIYTGLNDLFINDLKANQIYNADPADLTTTARKVKRDIEEAQKEYSSILKAIRDASSVAGVAAAASFAADFAKESAEHGKQARLWLYGLIALAAVTIVVAYNFLTYLIAKLSNKTLTTNEELVLKLLVLSLTLYAVRFIIKNFNAHKHLQVQNKHRSNVLNSVQAFTKSVDDPDLRNAIMIGGATTAYSASETGFITTKEGAGNSDGVDLMSLAELLRKKQ